MKHEGAIFSAQFSPNGKWVLTASWDKTARLGAPMKHEGSVLSAQFSPDGRRLITASDDRTARLWDATTGKPLTPSLQHGDKVSLACFSPDGRWVLTASADRTARLWSANSSQPFGMPMKHEDAVLWAQFSPDGRAGGHRFERSHGTALGREHWPAPGGHDEAPKFCSFSAIQPERPAHSHRFRSYGACMGQGHRPVLKRFPAAWWRDKIGGVQSGLPASTDRLG